MKQTANKTRNLMLVIGVVVALFAGVLSAYIYYKSEPVTEPSAKESKVSTDTQSSMLTGIMSLVFKNGLELVQVVRNSN